MYICVGQNGAVEILDFILRLGDDVAVSA